MVVEVAGREEEAGQSLVAEWTGSERAGLGERLMVVEVAGREEEAGQSLVAEWTLFAEHTFFSPNFSDK